MFNAILVMKQAQVFVERRLAGLLTEDDMGYEFAYDNDYLASVDPKPVSLTLPLSNEPYRNNVAISTSFSICDIATSASGE